MVEAIAVANPVLSGCGHKQLNNSHGLPAIVRQAAQRATPQLTFYTFSRKQLLLTTPVLSIVIKNRFQKSQFLLLYSTVAEFKWVFREVDILIESTRSFEKDIAKLNKNEKTTIVEEINAWAGLFPTQQPYTYCLPSLLPDLNGYESSLSVLNVSQELRLILSIEEDQLFEQVVFTLFRVVKNNDLHQAYKSVADGLYQSIAVDS